MLKRYCTYLSNPRGLTRRSTGRAGARLQLGERRRGPPVSLIVRRHMALPDALPTNDHNGACLVQASRTTHGCSGAIEHRAQSQTGAPADVAHAYRSRGCSIACTRRGLRGGCGNRRRVRSARSESVFCPLRPRSHVCLSYDATAPNSRAEYQAEWAKWERRTVFVFGRCMSVTSEGQ